MNILVSAIAGDIGFGVGRILRDWRWEGLIFGIDIQKEHPGSFVFDSCDIAPRANDDKYIDWLTSYIETFHIRYFVPMSEAEILCLSELNSKFLGNARILMLKPDIVRVALDKHECMNRLFSLGIRVPQHGLVGKSEPEKFPVIVKPRSGQGSKSIQLVRDKKAYNMLSISNQVWQDYLTPDDEEYTCPVYRSKGAGTRILVLRRTLQGGLTGRGEVVNNQQIEDYVYSIAEALNLEGSMNVQLRLTNTGPCLFEINPRLSSTVVFRDKMGFQDLKWWLSDAMGKEVPLYLPPKKSTKFYRGAQEYIFLPDEIERERILG